MPTDRSIEIDPDLGKEAEEELISPLFPCNNVTIGGQLYTTLWDC
jgi:hypothetical protein